MLKKIVSFVDQGDRSYKSLMEFIEGKERMCGRVVRPGFHIKNDLSSDSCLFFSVIPYEASVNRYIHTEYNGVIKCAVTILRPWQYAVISGMIDEYGENLPSYIISFDGTNAKVQEQNEFDFDRFKAKAKEFIEKKSKVGMSPQIQDLLTEIRSAQAEFASRQDNKKDETDR